MPADLYAEQKVRPTAAVALCVDRSNCAGTPCPADELPHPSMLPSPLLPSPSAAVRTHHLHTPPRRGLPPGRRRRRVCLRLRQAGCAAGPRLVLLLLWRPPGPPAHRLLSRSCHHSHCAPAVPCRRRAGRLLPAAVRRLHPRPHQPERPAAPDCIQRAAGGCSAGSGSGSSSSGMRRSACSATASTPLRCVSCLAPQVVAGVFVAAYDAGSFGAPGSAPQQFSRVCVPDPARAGAEECKQVGRWMLPVRQALGCSLAPPLNTLPHWLILSSAPAACSCNPPTTGCRFRRRGPRALAPATWWRGPPTLWRQVVYEWRTGAMRWVWRQCHNGRQPALYCSPTPLWDIR